MSGTNDGVRNVMFAENNKHAQFCRVDVDASPSVIRDALQTMLISSPKTILSILSNPEILNKEDDVLAIMFYNTFAQAVSDRNLGAWVVSDGVKGGTAGAVGKAWSDRIRKIPLVGVCSETDFPPNDECTKPIPANSPLEATHSHFVVTTIPPFARPSWHACVRVRLIQSHALARGVAVVVGFDPETDSKLLLAHVRRRIPILIVTFGDDDPLVMAIQEFCERHPKQSRWREYQTEEAEGVPTRSFFRRFAHNDSRQVMKRDPAHIRRTGEQRNRSGSFGGVGATAGSEHSAANSNLASSSSGRIREEMSMDTARLTEGANEYEMGDRQTHPFIDQFDGTVRDTSPKKN
eukprot:c52537_g1_i1.p1 GENE.c52537_g1_i1~~c52537_g1_i1.p1  ORF type:complete len:349 (-),score=61.52 c52537_g1_i1:82-1128(-)